MKMDLSDHAGGPFGFIDRTIGYPGSVFDLLFLSASIIHPPVGLYLQV
jgi:hypothetical protein